MSLTVLKKYDFKATDVLDISHDVKLLRFSAGAAGGGPEWQEAGVEGLLLAYQRRCYPYYALFILNTRSVQNFEETLTKELVVDLQPPYLVLTSCGTHLFALCFTNDNECIRFGHFIHLILDFYEGLSPRKCRDLACLIDSGSPAGVGVSPGALARAQDWDGPAAALLDEERGPGGCRKKGDGMGGRVASGVGLLAGTGRSVLPPLKMSTGVCMYPRKYPPLAITDGHSTSTGAGSGTARHGGGGTMPHGRGTSGGSSHGPGPSQARNMPPHAAAGAGHCRAPYETSTPYGYGGGVASPSPGMPQRGYMMAPAPPAAYHPPPGGMPPPPGPYYSHTMPQQQPTSTTYNYTGSYYQSYPPAAQYITYSGAGPMTEGATNFQYHHSSPVQQQAQQQQQQQQRMCFSSTTTKQGKTVKSSAIQATMEIAALKLQGAIDVTELEHSLMDEGPMPVLERSPQQNPGRANSESSSNPPLLRPSDFLSVTGEDMSTSPTTSASCTHRASTGPGSHQKVVPQQGSRLRHQSVGSGTMRHQEDVAGKIYYQGGSGASRYQGGTHQQQDGTLHHKGGSHHHKGGSHLHQSGTHQHQSGTLHQKDVTHHSNKQGARGVAAAAGWRSRRRDNATSSSMSSSTGSSTSGSSSSAESGSCCGAGAVGGEGDPAVLFHHRRRRDRCHHWDRNRDRRHHSGRCATSEQLQRPRPFDADILDTSSPLTQIARQQQVGELQHPAAHPAAGGHRRSVPAVCQGNTPQGGIAMCDTLDLAGACIGAGVNEGAGAGANEGAGVNEGAGAPLEVTNDMVRRCTEYLLNNDDKFQDIMYSKLNEVLRKMLHAA